MKELKRHKDDLKILQNQQLFVVVLDNHRIDNILKNFQEINIEKLIQSYVPVMNKFRLHFTNPFHACTDIIK